MEASPTTVPREQQRREKELIERVVHSFDGCDDPRLRVVLQSFVRHLHAFLREVRLTEDEWERAVAFLTDVGHITDDRRQEFILLSDVLGVSMQTIAMGNPAHADATEATVFGPFFVEGSPDVGVGGDIAGGAAGELCWVEGTVTDTDGNPVADARLEAWEADDDGFYDVQYDDGRTAARGHLFTDQEGRYAFWAITPTAYPIPHDGPVGAMLQAAGRSPMRPAHLHIMVTAPRYRRLVTHVFAAGDAFLGSDAVFGVKDSLVRDFVPQASGTPTPDGRELGDRSWTRVRFDIVLAPAQG